MSDGAATPGRLLDHRSGDGDWNMAVDQAIAESISADRASGDRASGDRASGDTAPPTLRFYTWRVPTLSLGYFQSARSALPRFADASCVRRSTGGGAILHHHELTYSFVTATKVGEHGARDDLYRTIHETIAHVLGERSITAMPFRRTAAGEGLRSTDDEPFLCFRRRTSEDLIVRGYKILGSAQRRFKRAILQHGSLLLRTSELAPELPGLFDLTSIDLSVDDLVSQLSTAIGDSLGISFHAGELDDRERVLADTIRSQRFANEQWWSRR